MIRIKKDYFRRGYYSLHESKFKNGKLVSESLISVQKKKADIIAAKKIYLRGK